MLLICPPAYEGGEGTLSRSTLILFCSALNSASDSKSENCGGGAIDDELEAVEAAEERRRPPAVLDEATAASAYGEYLVTVLVWAAVAALQLLLLLSMPPPPPPPPGENMVGEWAWEIGESVLEGEGTWVTIQ